MTTTEITAQVRELLAAGRPREARALLTQHRPPLDAELVHVAAEVYAATGRPRRAAAVLWLCARRLGDVAAARGAARALLEAGRHRRARGILEHHAADASTQLLLAVSRSEPLPIEAAPAVDIDDVLDHALAQPSSVATLRQALDLMPKSTRARLAVAGRMRAEGDTDGSRALLRAGLKGREDARLELPLAFAAIDDGAWDEAALVLARARARHPDLARRPDLRLVLALVTLQAGRRDDAISMLRGAERVGPLDAAALALLAPAPLEALLPSTTATTTTTTTTAATAAPAATATAAATTESGPPARAATKTGWTGPVVSAEAETTTNPWFRRAAVAVTVVAVIGVAAFKLIGSKADGDAGVRDAAIVIDAAQADDFARRVDQCGVRWPAVYEPGLLYAELAARLITGGYDGHTVSAGDVVFPLDGDLAVPGPQAKVRMLRSDGPTAPGVVLVDERAVGIAVAAAGEVRPTVGEVVQLGRMGLERTTTRPCAVADPGFSCVVAKTVCQDLAVVLSAVCPDGARDVSNLRTCAFDAVVVRPVGGLVVVVDAGLVGGADAGVIDAGSVDAAADAGVIDAGVIDAGDAAVVDAGLVDAGLAGDAGVVDAGATDAGLVDAGADAGRLGDAGSINGVPVEGGADAGPGTGP